METSKTHYLHLVIGFRKKVTPQWKQLQQRQNYFPSFRIHKSFNLIKTQKQIYILMRWYAFLFLHKELNLDLVLATVGHKAYSTFFKVDSYFFNIFIYVWFMFMSVCLHVCRCTHAMQCPQRSEKGVRTLRPGVTDGS